MLKKLIYPTIFTLAIFISSCNSCSNSQTVNKDSDPSLNFDSIHVINSTDAIFYAIPSPEEIINYIKDNRVKFNPELLHNYKEAKLYTSNEKKAIICGVYFADLAYISAFKKSDFSGDYLATIDYLLKELNISPNITKEQQVKIINSTSEPDSLYQISRDLYDTIISYLQEYDEGKTLSLLSIGTLIESLYITTYLHNDFKNQKAAINRIIEQKLLFEDIITMTETYKDNPVIKGLINDLKVLEKSFNNLSIETNVQEVKNNPDGSLLISGENKLTYTEENYFIFSDNLHDFRTRLIRQN